MAGPGDFRHTPRLVLWVGPPHGPVGLARNRSSCQGSESVDHYRPIGYLYVTDDRSQVNSNRAESRQVPELFAAARLDKTVKVLFDIPWSTTRNWIGNGKITVDDEVILSLDAVVSEGQKIVYTEDARKPRGETDFDPSCIVYIDAHVLVANKPSGILTIPFDQGDTLTFDRQIRRYLSKGSPRAKNRKRVLPSLVIVHRIDKGTSGLLAFARTAAAKRGLAEQFKAHTVKRTYLALVHGTAKTRTIKTHIMQNRGDGIRGSCESSPHPKVRRSRQGQLAISHVTLVERLKNASLISCQLETGRTNQIRIHLSEQGNPIVGETTYMRGFQGERIESNRLMLHAAELGFVHPITGKTLHFEHPKPTAFAKMLKLLRR